MSSILDSIDLTDSCAAHRSHDHALETIRHIREIESSHTGIINHLTKCVTQPDEPPLCHYEARLCDPTRWYGQQQEITKIALGTSACDVVALAKVIGESIERFCLYFCRPELVVYSRYNEIKDQALDPRTCALPSNEELLSNRRATLPLWPFSEKRKIGWVKGIELLTNKEILLPASFVYIGYQFNDEKERIIYPESTGAACGRSVEEALVKGILEVIERDSFMITWLNRIVPAEVVGLEKTNNQTLREYIRMLAHYPATTRIYLLPSDLEVYSVLVTMLHGDDRLPTLCSGMCASLDPASAITKAIEEAIMVSNRMRVLSRRLKIHQLRRVSGAWYSTKDSLKKAVFLLNNEKTIDLDELPAYGQDTYPGSLKHLLHTLKSKELSPICVDIGFQAIERLGFKIRKVIIPGMQPLSRGGVGGLYWFLTGRRISEVPAALGLKALKKPYTAPTLWC
jgi:ribosomal protein S12 methylthiotransferase accessory factor